jgi:hypothetical protein
MIFIMYPTVTFMISLTQFLIFKLYFIFITFHEQKRRRLVVTDIIFGLLKASGETILHFLGF